MKSAVRTQKSKLKNNWKVTTSWLLGLSLILSSTPNVTVNAQDTIRGVACPSEIEPLMNWMLEDLPSYANRVTQRARRGDRTVDIYNYIILAGQPEFEPLPLTNLQYEPELPDDTKQVFFTTLERQYNEASAIELQNYYWLFLVKSSDGWRSVLLFSQLADLEGDDPPLPSQDARNSAIGQGINLWLKDCRAGVLRRSDR